MQKVKISNVAGSVAKRLFHPRHIGHALALQRHRRKESRASNDPQLALMARMLPGGFLHYGYFDDPTRPPEEISLAEFGRAQTRYAEILLELAQDRELPVLDVGCGMGGLSRMLQEGGFSPVALTPDRTQAAHIGTTLPEIPVIRCKFEDLPNPSSHAGRFGTVFTSESLQYLKLDRALPLMDRILAPGGRWVACDMFRIGPSRGKGGHNWNDFADRVSAAGWEITYERDITPNVLPTLGLIHMFATNFGIPLLEFGLLKLRKKQPWLHYMLEDAVDMIGRSIDRNLEEVDPQQFVLHKKYVLLVLRRKADVEAEGLDAARAAAA